MEGVVERFQEPEWRQGTLLTSHTARRIPCSVDCPRARAATAASVGAKLAVLTHPNHDHDQFKFLRTGSLDNASHLFWLGPFSDKWMIVPTLVIRLILDDTFRNGWECEAYEGLTRTCPNLNSTIS